MWGLRCTDLNQGFVYGTNTPEMDMDFENLCTSFHYDEVFGTILNRFFAQAVTNYPLTVYGKGNQKRGFLNLIDTINCVNIAAMNPPKKSEFRVFNQFTEFKTLNELAHDVQTASKKIVKVSVKKIKIQKKMETIIIIQKIHH